MMLHTEYQVSRPIGFRDFFYVLTIQAKGDATYQICWEELET